MFRITYLLLLINLLVSISTFAQERKIEKNVYSNFIENKFDLALFELESLKEKYGDQSFFHYWKAIIYMEKISALKKFDYVEINRDSARIFLDYSLVFLDKAIETLTIDQLNINKEDFKILFPMSFVSPPNGETKYTNCLNSLKSDFQGKKEPLKELQYNLSLAKLIEEYKFGNRDISSFLKEIKPRVKSNPALNPLYGEVSKSTYMELANIRNQRELVQLQKEVTDKNWINYIKTYKDEEYLSIVPELEKLINNYYFKNLENQYQKIKNNAIELKTYLSNLEESKNLMETNSVKYISSKYGDIKFSNSYMDLRKVNYYKIINEGTIKMNENIQRQKKFEDEFTYDEMYEDNFENNTSGWYEDETENTINKIANGKFIFENKTAVGISNSSAKKIPTNNENFIISLNTTWIKGIENNSYNIIWGANGISDHFLFGISANGSYKYNSRQNGNYNYYIPWTTSEYINKNGSNILGVRRNENKIELYINYFKVNEFEFSEFYGDQIGVQVDGIQRIEFDDLKVGYTLIEELSEEAQARNEEALELGLARESARLSNLEENNDEEIHDGYGPGVKDINGNTYKTVYIGTQEWMGENLKVSKYNDGTNIPNITDKTIWKNNKSGAWCYYNNNEVNNDKYGKLYNWYAVSNKTNGNKNPCPKGWHIPTDDEWIILTDYIELDYDAINKLENSLFSLLGGLRSSDTYFYDIDYSCSWWSSSENDKNYAWNRILYGTNSNEKPHESRDKSGKNAGLSVRCLKD